MIPKMSLSLYALIGLGIALVATYGIQEVRIRSLQGENMALEERLEDLQLRHAAAKANISTLQSTLEKQNNAIQAMKKSRQDALARMKTAMDTAQRFRELQQEAVANLAQESGQSCEEGIALLDRELQL